MTLRVTRNAGVTVHSTDLQMMVTPRRSFTCKYITVEETNQTMRPAEKRKKALTSYNTYSTCQFLLQDI